MQPWKGELLKKSVVAHNQVSRDGLRDTFGQQGQKSVKMAEREAEERKLKREHAGISDHRTFRKGYGCFSASQILHKVLCGPVLSGNHSTVRIPNAA